MGTGAVAGIVSAIMWLLSKAAIPPEVAEHMRGVLLWLVPIAMALITPLVSRGIAFFRNPEKLN